ncbi:MAG: hypothetical protein Q9213_001142 [Squamulea squamosa]
MSSSSTLAAEAKRRENLVNPGWGWETPFIERKKDASLKAAQAKEQGQPLGQAWWEDRLADRERYWENKLHNVINELDAQASIKLLDLSILGQTNAKELQSKYNRIKKRCDDLEGKLQRSASEVAYYRAQRTYIEATNDNVTIPEYPGNYDGKSGKSILANDCPRKS